MKRKNENDEYEFGIHEVYYDDNGKIQSWTENSLVPVCASEEGLLFELNLLLDALKKDALIY